MAAGEALELGASRKNTPREIGLIGAVFHCPIKVFAPQGQSWRPRPSPETNEQWILAPGTLHPIHNALVRLRLQSRRKRAVYVWEKAFI